MDATLTLIGAHLCFHSRKARGLLLTWGIRHQYIRISFASSKAVRRIAPESVYHGTPLLLHGVRTVEDFRAFLLYIDSEFQNCRLAGSTPEQLDQLFQILDQLDTSVFPLLMAPALVAWAEKPGFAKLLRRFRVRNRIPREARDPQTRRLTFERSLSTLVDVVSASQLPSRYQEVLEACAASVLFGLRSLPQWWSIIESHDRANAITKRFISKISVARGTSSALEAPRGCPNRSAGS